VHVIDIDRCVQRYVDSNALLIFSYCRSTTCWHERVYNIQQSYIRAFININITQLCKHM